jgi:hypothetical protein
MRPSSRRAWLAAALFVVVLCSIRALLPVVVERRVVAALARNERYAGSFDDVDVSVLRLAYSIEGLRLVKRNGQVPVPFVVAPLVDYSFDGMALLRGRISGEIAITSPSLNIVDGPSPEVRQGPMGVDWRITMRKLFPTNMNRISVHDGTIHFRNFHTKPEVDVYIDDIELEAANVALRSPTPNTGAVRLHGRGVPMQSGSIKADVTLFRNTPAPSFDASLSIHGAQISEWNALLRAYLGLDVERGTARVDATLHARDGQLRGEVTPSLAELEVFDFARELASQSVLTSVGESLIDVGAFLLRDQSRHVIEVRIPLSGTIRNPKHDNWASVRSLAREALVEALERVGDAVPGAS